MNKDNRGGKREGAGAPPKLKDGKRVNVYLDDKTAETVREYGDGNLSEGIRRSARMIEKGK